MSSTISHESSHGFPPEPHEFCPTSPSAHSDRVGRGIQKSRRLSSTGGGRAWTEEEEAYLLRTRLHKMPYKHIATHLRKTELACRLHYHQMSYGSNRRRRTESMSSSTSSYGATSGQQGSSLEYKSSAHHSPAPQAPPSPESTASSTSSISHSSDQARSHVPILPKLDSLPLHPPQPIPVDLSKSLRLDTSLTQPQSVHSPSPSNPIDMIRLRALYDAYRDSFWSLIANEYSKDSAISGHQLEQAFFRATFSSDGNRVPSPPTPGPSPKDATLAFRRVSLSVPALTSVEHGGFQAINNPTLTAAAGSNATISSRSPVEKCAVASLLTVEREVWTSKGVSTASALSSL